MRLSPLVRVQIVNTVNAAREDRAPFSQSVSIDTIFYQMSRPFIHAFYNHGLHCIWRVRVGRDDNK